MSTNLIDPEPVPTPENSVHAPSPGPRSHPWIPAIVVLAILLILAIGGGVLLYKNSQAPTPATTTMTQTATTQANASQTPTSTTTKSSPTDAPASVNFVPWDFTGQEWRSVGNPPACPSPIEFAMPVNLAKVTSILYPGQTRGGNYKPHGGFRFDGSTAEEIGMTAPIDGYVIRAGRYLAGGETQYTFDFLNPCGIMYRVGHLLALSPEFAAIAKNLPAAVEGDSRTQEVNPPVFVKQGAVIATAVGIKAGDNTFVDWGVYDLRSTNSASKDPTWVSQHADERELAWHGVCWFDMLSASDEATVRSLPAADPTSGKTSDYCK